MNIIVASNRDGRRGLIEALEGWKDIHEGHRDDLIKKVKETMEGGSLAAMASAANEANEMNMKVANVRQFLARLQHDHANNEAEQKPKYDVEFTVPHYLIDVVDHALENYTDMLADETYEAIPVIQPNESSVSLDRDMVIKLRAGLHNTVSRLAACERMLGYIRGRVLLAV